MQMMTAKSQVLSKSKLVVSCNPTSNTRPMSPQKPKPQPTPPPKRSWYIHPRTKKLHCYKHDNNDCAVVGLWQAAASELHDAELQSATDEINKILDRVEQDNEDSARRLSFIKFRRRWMLVWIHEAESITSENPEDQIAKALKLRGYKRRQR